VFSHSYDKQLKIVLGCALAAALPACSRSTTGQAPAGGAQARALSGTGDSRGVVFYLEQTGTVANIGGVNEDLHTYKSLLKNCEDAHQPIVALSAADEAKLGTARVKYWHDGNNRSALLIEEYHPDASASNGVAMCAFRLGRAADLSIVNGDRMYGLDLVKRTGEVQTIPTGPALDAPADPPDWNQLAAAGVRKSGSGGFAGQACAVMKDDMGQSTYCVWSGGAKWGYGVQAPEEFPTKLEGHTPVFWSRSDNGGNGFSTTDFVVGRLPDTGIFDIPRDIHIKNMDGP
jgi:hypothetical protein